MKKVLGIFCVFGMMGLSLTLTAQRTDKGEKSAPANSKNAPVVHTYLGQSDMTGGKIPRDEFNRLLKQGLRAKDSSGNSYRVDGFFFSYAERNLYEDSVGNLMMMTDYMREYCVGDTVSRAISLNIFDRTKPGDTAYFDNIRVNVNGAQQGVKTMRFVLTK